MIVSICIPLWGDFNQEYFQEALSSAQGQQSCYEFEVVYKLAPPLQSNLSRERNELIQKAKGDWIICLDADDRLARNYVEKTLACALANNVDIVYTQVLEFGRSQGIQEMREFDSLSLPHANCIVCSALFRKEVWRKYPFNEDMTWGYEDWDFWVGAIKNGFTAKRLAEPLFYYQIHETSMVTEARAHHQELYQKIQAHHRQLYAA